LGLTPEETPTYGLRGRKVEIGEFPLAQSITLPSFGNSLMQDLQREIKKGIGGAS
jgi:hypothetical protein